MKIMICLRTHRECEVIFVWWYAQTLSVISTNLQPVTGILVVFVMPAHRFSVPSSLVFGQC